MAAQDSVNHTTPNTPETQPQTSPKSILRYWPALVVVVVVMLLIGLYLFTINQFNSHITVDHAQHGQDSPHVHPIVHVRQKLLVGIDPANPPFSFKPAGELVGFDVDLSKAIARELNVPVEFVEYEFSSSLSTGDLGSNNPLTEDKVDVVVSGVTVNRLRQQYYDFSRPYLSAGLVAVTRSGSTSIQQSSDISGKLLGVIEDSPTIDFAKASTAADRILTYGTREEGVAAVLDGSVDALLVEAPVAQSLIADNQEIHIATDLLTHDDYAVMVMRGEDDLTDEIDSILNLLRQKGVLESLRHKWLE